MVVRFPIVYNLSFLKGLVLEEMLRLKIGFLFHIILASFIPCVLMYLKFSRECVLQIMGLGILGFFLTFCLILGTSYYVFKTLNKHFGGILNCSLDEKKISYWYTVKNTVFYQHIPWRWTFKLVKNKYRWVLCGSKERALLFPTDQLPPEAQAFILQKLTEHNVPIIG
ncbi:MAG: hypothetical protein H2174_00225 [Vampirovibrio sp.]|nr:hypothetical protein [Vampirovibrio sp.]